MHNLIWGLLGVVFVSFSSSAETYWVSQYRAAPGNFPALLDLVKGVNWKAMDEDQPIIMRHSQGNHWDLMLLGKHGKSCTNEACIKSLSAFDKKVKSLVDYEMSFVANSETNWQTLKSMNMAAGLYHIEMFNAAAGKHDALMRQRRIENDYLATTGQVTNVIFTVGMGSDIDIFTVGFHESLKSFAESPDLPSEVFEKAAVEAGFKNRADISFHLRELIVGHHDTLASKVE